MTTEDFVIALQFAGFYMIGALCLAVLIKFLFKTKDIFEFLPLVILAMALWPLGLPVLMVFAATVEIFERVPHYSSIKMPEFRRKSLAGKTGENIEVLDTLEATFRSFEEK